MGVFEVEGYVKLRGNNWSYAEFRIDILRNMEVRGDCAKFPKGCVKSHKGFAEIGIFTFSLIPQTDYAMKGQDVRQIREAQFLEDKSIAPVMMSGCKMSIFLGGVQFALGIGICLRI